MSSSSSACNSCPECSRVPQYLGLARMSSSVLALGISIWEYWRTVRPERIVRLTRRNGLVLRNRVRDTMAEFVEVMFSIPEMLVRSDERA